MGKKIFLILCFMSLLFLQQSSARSLRSLMPVNKSLRKQLFNVNFADITAGKLIIDTDAGADDAIAIFMALKEEIRNPDLKITAITCVNGNTALDNVVVNVLKILKTENRLDIPVYRGATNSIIWTPPSDNYFGQDGFGDFEFPDPPDPNEYLQKEHAVNALIQLVNENPGEITLVCLGPLTNVALAIQMDRTFLTKLKQLVVMGGSVEGHGNMQPGIEFNFFVDPEANFIVFNSTDTSNENIQPIILVPYESVALRNTITKEWRKNVLGVLNTPEVELINKAEIYQLEDGNSIWECSDCFAIAVILDSSITTETVTHHLLAVHDGSATKGAVLTDYNDSVNIPPNAIIVKSIDIEKFKNILLTGIGGLSLKRN